MNRFATALILLLGTGFACFSAVMKPADLRCEYMRNPEGLCVLKPRLSWILEPSSRGARSERQTGWQVLVASNKDTLNENVGDLWDSGQVQTDQTIHVEYDGLELKPLQQCFWKVRVWDQQGRKSDWSEIGTWSMGLTTGEWKGRWIGKDEPEAKSVYQGTWIWFPEGSPEKSAAVGKAYFRKPFQVPDGRLVVSAKWFVTGDDRFAVYLNGSKVGEGSGFKAVTVFDVAAMLKARENLLAASVENAGSNPTPAGFTGILRVDFDSGEPLIIETDANWLSTVEEFQGWEKVGFDDSTWLKSKTLGKAGMMPWGEVAMPDGRRLPARYLRKEFVVAKKIQKATVCYSGLGLSELYLNGSKVGDEVLSPGLTEYDKRVFYLTHDVTGLLRQGDNAIGVILGNGRFYAPRSKSPVDTRSFGFPKLMFQMTVKYTDGTIETIVSDSTWKLSVDGPIRANNEYDGEEYDAGMEFGSWAEAGFNDSQWQNAQEIKGPEGRLVGQPTEPIRVVQTLKPVRITEPSPGVYVFDMGQNMVGWCRLRVSGPQGTIVRLRHAETLKPDGTLYMDNLRGARVTDLYSLKGKGREVYEPRFTYHGFRFVEVTGFPGKPNLGTLEGRVVHDDLEWTGSFESSNPLLNRIYSNVVWGVRGNYRSMPTDCPQRDERQGWLGDRAATSRGETYIFNTAPLYSKWLHDMADGQKESGSVSDVCPAYWPFYSDNVTWPSCLVIVPGTLYDQFGDLRIIREIYPAARKWLLHMSGFVSNGLISKDSYGDWCVPPEDPKLIHSNDPARKTDTTLLATAYLYYDSRLLARYASLQGLEQDAREYDDLAERLRTALNEKFFDPKKALYGNGSQTSAVLPLAFGLAPEEARERLFNNLVEKISVQSKNHIGTGLIGAQWLMRVLTQNGRGDLAYTIASQDSYPSWGYMVAKDATTVWELWNGDTADPAMNSGNHVMLVGDLIIWMYEHLAGIKPDPQNPGFGRIMMRPETPEGLSFVRASQKTVRGTVSSEWKRNERGLRWQVQVPPNTTAILEIPAASADQVREDGKALPVVRGLKVVGAGEGRLLVEVGSGKYDFTVR